MITRKLSTLLLVLAITVAVGFALVWPQLPASAHGESVKVVPSQAKPGDSVTITGQGFESGEEVGLSLSSARGRVALGHADVDKMGSFSVTVSIPSDVVPGSYQLVATTRDGEVVTDFVASGVSGRSGEGGTEVVFQRSTTETIVIGVITAALIAAGTFLVIAGTERRA